MLTIVVVVLSVLVLVAAALLVAGLLKPGLAARLIPWAARPEPSRKRVAAVLAPILAGCALLLVGVSAIPRFEVSLPAGAQVVAGESRQLTVAVRNASFSSGSYTGECSLDGSPQPDVIVHVAGGDTAEIEVPLPEDLAPGAHEVVVGGEVFAVKALRPATFSVTQFKPGVQIARTGEKVEVFAAVTNTGEAPGEFDGQLWLDGAKYDTQPCTILPGGREELLFTVSSSRQGRHTVRLGDATRTFAVVKPVRYANGHYLRRVATGGRGELRVKNGNRVDAVVILTRSTAPRTPIIACYITAGRSFTIGGIPDGKYRIYYSLGREWNTYTDGFLTLQECGRFDGLHKFTTQTWTTSWNDSAYRYTQGHARYTVWRVTLNPVAGGTARTIGVPESELPKVR